MKKFTRREFMKTSAGAIAAVAAPHVIKGVANQSNAPRVWPYRYDCEPATLVYEVKASADLRFHGVKQIGEFLSNVVTYDKNYAKFTISEASDDTADPLLRKAFRLSGEACVDPDILGINLSEYLEFLYESYINEYGQPIDILFVKKKRKAEDIDVSESDAALSAQIDSLFSLPQDSLEALLSNPRKAKADSILHLITSELRKEGVSAADSITARIRDIQDLERIDYLIYSLFHPDTEHITSPELIRSNGEHQKIRYDPNNEHTILTAFMYVTHNLDKLSSYPNEKSITISQGGEPRNVIFTVVKDEPKNKYKVTVKNVEEIIPKAREVYFEVPVGEMYPAFVKADLGIIKATGKLIKEESRLPYEHTEQNSVRQR